MENRVVLDKINTEQRNERTANIDVLETSEIIKLINDEDKKVAYAVEKEVENIAKAVEIIYEKINSGGRLIYCGCGTSGRLGILDAVECPPTFGTDSELVQGLIAGGTNAFIKAVEGAEDNEVLGEKDLKGIAFNAKDVVVGIAASGRTPYVLGALKYAKSIGAKTIGVTCCSGSKVDEISDIGICPEPGPEIITGSTRLKSGTAQKMVLNMLSTTTMIKLGKVYGNLMVDVKATNEKLLERAVFIVVSVTGVSENYARKILKRCEFSAKIAIVMIQCDIDENKAKDLIDKAGGHISKVIND